MIASQTPSYEDIIETRRCYGLLIPFVLFLGSVVSLALVVRNADNNHSLTSNVFDCLPNGTPIFPWRTVSKSKSRLWNVDMVLSVTLAFGKLSFTQAKAIDICWDLIIGRGGQLLLSLLAWCTMRRSLLSAMESKPVRIPVLATLTFDKVSLSLLWTVIKDFVGHRQPYARKRRSNLLMGLLCMRRADSSHIRRIRMMLFAIIIGYIFIFATIVSAMTGYQAALEPYCPDPESMDLIPTSDFAFNDTGLVLRDGTRINSTDGALFLWEDNENYKNIDAYSEILEKCTSPLETQCVKNDKSNVYQLSSVWISWNGPFCDCKTNKCEGSCSESQLVFNGRPIHLPSPPLTIEEVSVYNRSDSLLTADWMEEQSSCKPLKDYQWGFSALLLFIFLVLTCIFASALLILECDVLCSSQCKRPTGPFSMYWEILVFARAIVDAIGPRVWEISNKDLDREIESKLTCMYVMKESDSKPGKRGWHGRRLGDTEADAEVELDDAVTGEEDHPIAPEWMENQHGRFVVYG